MKKSEEVYQELRKTYNDEELAESFIFSVVPSEREEEEFLKLRLERLQSMADEELLSLNLFTFKMNLKNYFKTGKYDEHFSFSKQLRKYIALTGRSNTDIAKNLGIHKTKLSRLINNRDSPNIDLMYRLEAHSNKVVPAFYWWRIYSKELEFTIKTDYKRKKSEAGKVENPLRFTA